MVTLFHPHIVYSADALKIRLLFPLQQGNEFDALSKFSVEPKIYSKDSKTYVLIAEFTDAITAYRLGRGIQKKLKLPFELHYDQGHPQADGKWINLLPEVRLRSKARKISSPAVKAPAVKAFKLSQNISDTNQLSVANRQSRLLPIHDKFNVTLGSGYNHHIGVLDDRPNRPPQIINSTKVNNEKHAVIVNIIATSRYPLIPMVKATYFNSDLMYVFVRMESPEMAKSVIDKLPVKSIYSIDSEFYAHVLTVRKNRIGYYSQYSKINELKLAEFKSFIFDRQELKRLI